MNKFKKIAVAAAAAISLCFASGCSSEEGFMGNTGEVALEDGDVFAIIHIMDYGDITVKLFPQAAPNAVKRFIKFAEDGVYDNRTIHRVVKDKLIQGGSLTGTGFDGDVTSQEYFAEETSKYMCHYFGALCMAKNDKGNYCQFYMVSNNNPVDINEIVDKLNEDLSDTEKTDKMTDEDKDFYRNYCNELSSIPDAVKERYAQVGGIYDYDGDDTVFGQLVDGADVLKAINNVETVFGNNGDDKSEIPSKPLDEIVIEKIEVVRIAPAETEATQKTRATRATASEPQTQQIIVEGGGSGGEATEGSAATVNSEETPAATVNSEETPQ